MIARKQVTTALATLARRVSTSRMKKAKDLAQIHPVPPKSERLAALAEATEDSIDWNRAMDVIKRTEQLPQVDKAQLHEQLPVLNPTYSLTTLVNDSTTLRKLVDLGVDLSQWETRGGLKGAGLALSLDFDGDVAPRIQFLVDLGVHPDRLGHIFTNGGPELLKTDMDALKTRVEYLQWKKFSKKAVVKIVTECPEWLNHTVADIDRRLGYFQSSFELTGDGVRSLATSGPDLVVWKGVHMAVERVKFLLTELEFSKGQIRRILTRAPEVFKNWDEGEVRETCEVLCQMYTNGVMLHEPQVIALPKHDVRIRHEFLTFLGKAQYDPQTAGYVPPQSLLLDDEAFCARYAKVPLRIYHKFLLTV